MSIRLDSDCNLLNGGCTLRASSALPARSWRSTVRRRAAPSRRPRAKRPSTLLPPTRSSAVWFSVRSRQRRSRTKSPPSRSFWTRSTSKARPRRSTPWAASARSPGKSDKGADFLLALKDNQPRLAEDLRLFEQKAKNFADTTVEQAQTVDGDPGRIETRKVTVYQDVKWLQDRHAWPGLKSVVKVESRREIGDKIETETRFYLASAVLTALAAVAFVRVHWGIENSLHWVLDMVMRDDESRVRTGNAAANLAIIKHIAYNLIRRGKGKHSFRAR